jgi:hypothetical protein
VKRDIVRERNFKALCPAGEDVAELDYRPRARKRDYRVVALR